MAKEMTKGRISNQEDRFIRANIDKMSADEMAAHLNRNPNSVNAYVKKKYGRGLSSQEKAQYTLQDRPYYRELQEQFTESELDLFQYHWGKIVAQFNDDVFPTEELQIIDVIKLEILMNRCLKTDRDNLEEISKLDKQIKEYEDSKLLEDEEIEMLMNLEKQRSSLRSVQETISRNYKDYQTKKSAMLKDMKATREQRIKRLEDAKESFSSWVANLADDTDKLKRYGIEMEKMRLAMEGEKDRLAQYHTYEDGTVDQPFLNHETVV